MSTTLTSNIHQQEGRAAAMSMEPIEQEVIRLPEPQAGLDVLDFPQDAADILGFAVQSSGLQLPESGQQYIVEGDNITNRAPLDLSNSSAPTYHEEQRILMAQQQEPVDQFGRQLIISPEQQMMIQPQFAQGGELQVIFL